MEGKKPLEGLDKKGNGLVVTTEDKLDTWLQKSKHNRSTRHESINANTHTDDQYQSTVKRLRNRTSDIYEVDLRTSDQVKEASTRVNHDQNVGSVKVSLLKWHLERYRELHIISHSDFKPKDVEVELQSEEAEKV